MKLSESTLQKLLSAVDPDTYFGTQTYVNSLDLLEPKRLREFESDVVFLNSELYRTDPYDGLFDLLHLQAIHYTLFKDVYEWAGRCRSFDTRKGICEFTSANDIRKFADEEFCNLNAENRLIGLDREEYVARIAHYYSRINKIHPFPDGNGRAQRLFFEQLAAQNNYQIAWRSVPQWQIDEVAIKSFSDGLETTIYMFDQYLELRSDASDLLWPDPIR